MFFFCFFVFFFCFLLLFFCFLLLVFFLFFFWPSTGGSELNNPCRRGRGKGSYIFRHMGG